MTKYASWLDFQKKNRSELEQYVFIDVVPSAKTRASVTSLLAKKKPYEDIISSVQVLYCQLS